jgi:hypothetical protein
MQLYDTWLSYRLQATGRRLYVQIDWWYDRGMRHRWWFPLEVRVRRITGC